MNGAQAFFLVGLALLGVAIARRGLRPGQRRLEELPPLEAADAGAPIVVTAGRFAIPTAIEIFPRGSG